MATNEELVLQLRADLSQFRSEMNSVSSTVQNTATSSSQSFGKIGDTLGNVAKVGAAAFGAIAVAAGGAVVAAGVMTSSFVEARGKLQAMTGVSEKVAKTMTADAKAIWQNGWGENIGEVNETMGTLYRNLGKGMKGFEKETTQASFVLRDTFGIEATETGRAVASMMSSFDIKDPVKAMDVLTGVLQRTKGDAGEIADSFWEYSVQVKKLGFSAEEFGSALVSAGEKGGYSVDKLGDVMKEFSIRSIDGSKASAAGFEAIGLSAKGMTKKFGEGGDTARKAFSETVTALEKIKDPIKQNAAGVALFGTMFEDLGMEAVSAMDVSKKEMIDFSGTTKAAGDVLSNNLGSKFKEIKRTFMGSFVSEDSPIYQFLLDLTDKLSKHLPAIIATANGLMSGFIDTLSKVGNGLKGLFGGFDTTSLTTSLEKVKDAIKEAAITGQSAPDVARQMFGEGFEVKLLTVRENLIKVRDTFTSVFDVLGGMENASIGSIANVEEMFGTNVTGFLLNLKDNLQKVSDVFTSVIGVFTGGASVKEIISLDKLFGKGFSEGLIKTKDDIANIIGGLSEVFLKVSTKIIEVWGVLWTGIKPTVMKVLSEVVPFIQGILSQLSDFWDENGKTILNAVDNVFNIIKGIIEFVMPAINLVILVVWDSIKSIIQGALNVVLGAIKIFSGLFTGDFGKMWEGILQTLSGAIVLFLEFFKFKFIGKIFENLGAFVKKFAGDIGKGFSDAFSAVTTWLGKISNDVSTTFMNILMKPLQWGKDLIKFFVDGISSMFAKPAARIKDMLETMYLEVLIKTDAFKKMGKDLIDGLIKGVKDKLKDAVAAVGEVASKMTDKVKNLFGIKSPSRVFKQIGIHNVEGLILGLKGMKSSLVASSVDTFGSILDPIGRVVAQASEMMDFGTTMSVALSTSGLDALANTERIMNYAVNSEMNKKNTIVVQLSGELAPLVSKVESTITKNINNQMGGRLV